MTWPGVSQAKTTSKTLKSILAVHRPLFARVLGSVETFVPHQEKLPAAV